MLIPLLLVCFIFIFSSTQDDQNLREDYKYIEALESFYKIHMQHRTWPDAEGICTEEGANLFYPKGVGEALEFINVLSVFNGTSSNLIINAVSNVIADGMNKTLDGVPLSDLYTNWGPFPSEDNKYPFICKKSHIPNHQCTIPISGYTYSEQMGRCYKFHLDPKNWTDAAEACNREQSYLAIINSDVEANFLANLTENVPKESVTGDYLRGMVHLGFRKYGADWKTIDGIKLEDSGYPKWSYNQPDGPAHGVEESCGSMFYGGDLNDIGCQVRGFFICEHESRKLIST